MDWQKQFEAWWDNHHFIFWKKRESHKVMIEAAWQAARKATLEEVLEMSVYSSYVDAIDIEDIKKKLEELE